MAIFKELGLNPEITKSLDELGFSEPTPIQERAIPFILESKNDLIALAQTGTGKTAAFSLPILNQIKANEKKIQAVIICPTRELCLQISQDIKNFAKNSKGVAVTAVYGGERIETQINSLRRGANIIVGTPGRVHDLIRRKVLLLNNVKWIVLDEADEMLDMGFKEDLDAILGETPENRQTLLFSATISKSVHSIAKQYMSDAKEISVGEKNIGADKVTHEYYIVKSVDRFEALRRILDALPGVYGILFCRTRRETQEVADSLKQFHYDTEALHGDISQGARTKIMERFKKKQVRLLVATDVAARGIDVSNLSHVINYNLPDQNEAYTHRSGRTGRAQNTGVSISIITNRDERKIRDLERIIGKKFTHKKVPSGQDVFKRQVDNFIEEIESKDIKSLDDNKYLDEVVDKLKKVKKEDLIKFFISHRFDYLIEGHKDSRDLNATAKNYDRSTPSSNADDVYLKVNLGKNQGLDIKGVFSLFNSNKKLKGTEIGKISLMPEFVVFSVAKTTADMVIKNLNGTKFRGKKIDVSRTLEMPAYQKRRGASANRKFRKKRGYSDKRR